MTAITGVGIDWINEQIAVERPLNDWTFYPSKTFYPTENGRVIKNHFLCEEEIRIENKSGHSKLLWIR